MNRTHVLILVIGLSAGIGIGAVIFSPPVEVTRELTLPELGGAAQTPPTVTEPMPALEPERMGASSREGVPLQGSASRIEDESDPTIRGIVRAGSGEPLSGLTLQLTRRGLDPTTLEVMTDGSGRFAATVSVDADYALRAASGDWILESLGTGKLDSLRAGDEVSLIARRAVELPVRVLLPEGGMPDEARIESVGGGHFGSPRKWTPAQPHLRLAPGSYRLRATAPGYERSRTHWAMIGPDRAEEVTLTLGKATGQRHIRLRVTAGPDESWEDVTLTWNDVSTGAEIERLKDVIWKQGEAKLSAEDHEIEIAVNGVGEYRLILWRSRSVAAHRFVTVGDFGVEVEMELPPMDPGNSVLLTVLDPWGAPMSDFRFKSHLVDGDESRSSSPLRRLPDGRSRVFVGQLERDVLLGRSPGDVSWFLYSRQFGRQEAEPRTSGQLVVQFQEPALLEVVCHVADRQPDERQKLRVVLLESRSTSKSTSLDEQGVARFGPLSPGEYGIRLERKVGGSRPQGLGVVRVDVRPGSNHATMGIPPLYDLRVYGTALATPRTLRLRSLDELLAIDIPTLQKSREEHHFRELPPGRYTLTVSGDPPIERTIDIPQETEVEVKL